MKPVLLFIASIALLAFTVNPACAAKVDTVLTHSAAMNKDIKAVIVTPNDYAQSKKYPVVYLLHGFGGNYADWVKSTPEKGTVASLSDLYHVIVVCPDGSTSWYLNSPVNPAFKYETYVSSELVSYVDSHYATIKDRSGRAITGLSMGGHGALYLAFRHQDVYGACGSMSGGVDIRPFPNNWKLSDDLGKYSENPKNWDDNSVVNLTHLLTPNTLAISFECGSEDFFYRVNVDLHNKLLERNIPHDFTVRPGGHTWQYWGNAINYQMLFFNRFFSKAAAR